METRNLLKDATRKIKVHLDSKTFDDLLGSNDRLAVAILRHHDSDMLEFVRSPFETKHEELKKVVEYRLLSTDHQVESIEIVREGSEERMLFGYQMKDIRTTAASIYQREPKDGEELDRIVPVFVQAVFNRFDESGLYITHDKVLLKNRSWFESHFPGRRLGIMSTDEASRFLDLFFKKGGQYFVTGRFSLNKGYWYWLSMRLKLPRYNVGDPLLDAMAFRFYYCLMALDEIGIQFYSGVTNDTQDSMLYHFNYTISLITGIFDNLALKTNSHVRINFADLRKVSLSNKSGREFLDAVRDKDPKIRNHINSYVNFIQLIYTFRELVLHREGLAKTAFQYRGEDATWQANMVEITGEQTDHIKQCHDAGSNADPLPEWGVYKTFLEPYKFSRKALTWLARFVDEYLGMLGQLSFIDQEKAKPNESFAQTLLSFEKYHLGF